MYENKIENIFTVYGDFERVIGDTTINGDEIYYKNGDVELKSTINKHSSGVFVRNDSIKNISGKKQLFRYLTFRFLLFRLNTQK